jgi:predicted MFS family arabinose efflux permease
MKLLLSNVFGLILVSLVLAISLLVDFQEALDAAQFIYSRSFNVGIALTAILTGFLVKRFSFVIYGVLFASCIYLLASITMPQPINNIQLISAIGAEFLLFSCLANLAWHLKVWILVKQ